MNLLKDPWIPVRANGGTRVFRLLTYQQLLCELNNWQVSLPRDDLELACVQLLVCMTQVIFLPEDNRAWQKRLKNPLSVDEFAAGIKPCHDWFDLDHPTQPFMQSRGVKAAENTPIQKLLIGLPEGNNHAFFNEAGEVRNLSGTLAAIALFNQASNSPSFGGGFKGSLRGGAPITTLVYGNNLREMVWRNVLTRPHILRRQIAIPGFEYDQPTWVKPIQEKAIVPWNEIGLMRGLFWQPARVELMKSEMLAHCDVLGGEAMPGYSSFRKEKFNFTVEGVWPHPHGAMIMNPKKDPSVKFSSFTTTAPAWTLLSEFVVPKNINALEVKEGSIPAEPITQANELGDGDLHLLIGGYRTNQASVLERRHEMISLAQGWQDDKGRLPKLVEIGKEAKKVLRGRLYFAVQGNKDKGLKGIGAAIHEIAEKMFYVRTESLIHETFSNDLTYKEWPTAYSAFVKQLTEHCRAIFEELTDPYALKPELIPVIAWARRSMNIDLAKLMEKV
ncbi:MAG: type I-E CRISPR-associated protein Cse1/CasA [Nitrosomonas sp.]|nr:type I-E CRISPR-associated protein Cse1/CasA [Nitrosomonas sp.]